MAKKFVLTDIHGCYLTFRYVLEEMMAPAKSDQIYILGDLINKGPSSKQVLDYVFEMEDQGYQVICLRGNHEQLFLDYLNHATDFFTCIDKGGLYTLQDFKVENPKSIPSKYLQMMQSFDYFIELPDFLLVHAGFDFTSPQPFEPSDSMLNIRKMEAIEDNIGNKKIIHGHVPLPLNTIIRQFDQPANQNIFLDAGCVYPHRQGMGFLVGLELNNFKLYVKECLDIMP
ncbi:MAG: metallophosphoesterase [Candidatus Cyclobacteriaceae bacterium M3_2C_046]